MTLDLQTLGYQRDRDLALWTRPDPDAFGYSDGDAAENWVADAVTHCSDLRSTSRELTRRIVDWPSRYHLSPQRGNVVRPLLDTLTGPVLEVGAGMGAITRVLGESGLDVVAVEGSQRRARICATRCRDLGNVRVVADTIQAFGAPTRFGTVVMIGVLEYARTFGFDVPGREPVDVMLEHIASLLAPGGRLVLAIENQLGAKYFAGFPEDHLGRRMVGVEDGYGPGTAVTFGREELTARLASAGLPHQQWYFPFPDYKLPSAVLTDAAFEPGHGFDPTSLIVGTAHQDPQEPAVTTFDLARTYPALIRNRLLPAMSNSFVVMASAAPVAEPTELAWYYGTASRREEIDKRLVFSAGEHGPRVRRIAPDGTATDVEHQPGRLWWDELVRITGRRGWDLAEAGAWFDRWWTSLGTAAATELTASTVLPAHLLDAIPRNLVVDGDVATFIDLEWDADHPLDIAYLTFRALLYSFEALASVAEPAAGTPTTLAGLITALGARVGLVYDPDLIARCWQREVELQSLVTGQQPTPGSGFDRPLPVGRGLDQALLAADELDRTRAAVREALARFVPPADRR